MIYSRNTYGPYKYPFVPRADPATSKQQAWRSTLSLESAGWRYTAQSRRDAWEEYAANVPSVNVLGRTYYPTGFNRYCGAATWRQINGEFPPYNAPESFTLGYHGAPSYHQPMLFRNRVRVYYDLDDTWRSSYYGRIMMWQSKAQTENVHYYRGPWHRFAGAVGNPVTPTTTGIFFLAHASEGGKPIIHFKSRIIESDNRLSPPTYATCKFY